jgi:hypothetical protein
MKTSATKVLLYFVWIAGCWNSLLLSQRTIDISPAFLEHSLAEKIAV